MASVGSSLFFFPCLADDHESSFMTVCDQLCKNLHALKHRRYTRNTLFRTFYPLGHTLNTQYFGPYTPFLQSTRRDLVLTSKRFRGVSGLWFRVAPTYRVHTHVLNLGKILTRNPKIPKPKNPKPYEPQTLSLKTNAQTTKTLNPKS